MKLYIKLIPLLLLLLCCTKPSGGEGEEQIVYEKMVEQVNLPASVSVEPGSVYRIAGKGFVEGDLLLFESQADPFTVPLENIGAAEASFTFIDIFISGTDYNVFLQREKLRRQRLGRMKVYLKEASLSSNISGSVTCSGNPVAGVWVTDGYVWSKTGTDGKYKMLSDKKAGYVYIVTPSGYEVAGSNPFRPFWQALSTSDRSTAEVHDFALVQKNNDKHTVLFTADWHIRNEWNPKDIVQIQDYLNEANAYANKSSVPVYSIPLGDITWEVSWYDHNFFLSDWKNLVALSTMQIYPVIGNHDHDYKAVGDNTDFDSAASWRTTMGPNYYSMDIGKVHYLFVDDVFYRSDGTIDGRQTIESIPDYQMDWIRTDLSHVSAVTPLVVSLHVPLHGWSWNGYFWNAANRSAQYNELRELFERFEEVHIYSGHSHTSEFFDAKSQGLSNTNMTERKVPAVGGSIWRTRTVRDYTITIDGVPGGYDIFEVDGQSIKWRFKAIGKDDSYQLRAYDMNSVKSYWYSTPAAVSLAAEHPECDYEKLWGDLPENTVLLNVFAGDPRMDGLSIEVFEGTTSLKVKPWCGADPLHEFGAEIAHWAASHGLPGVTYLTSTNNTHLFAVTASSANSCLTIKLKDRFGKTNEYSVKLPKAFKDEDSF